MSEKREDSDWKSVMSCLTLTGYLGFLMAATIFGGFLVGWGLDRLLGTKITFRIIFLIFGVVGGFVNVYREIVRRLG